MANETRKARQDLSGGLLVSEYNFKILPKAGKFNTTALSRIQFEKNVFSYSSENVDEKLVFSMQHTSRGLHQKHELDSKGWKLGREQDPTLASIIAGYRNNR